MKKFAACLIVLLISTCQALAKNSTETKAANSSLCAQGALENSKKLFQLHYGAEESASNGGATFSPVEEKSPMKSPDGKRKYKIFETTAQIGKMGQYRIHMIYAQLGDKNFKDDCVLMGQEILDLSSL